MYYGKHSHAYNTTENVWASLYITLKLTFILFTVRISLKWHNDKHEQKWIKGTSHFAFLAIHHAWPTEFCQGWFSPMDMNNFPSDNGRTGRRSERESTKPTCNCQLFPEEAAFRSLSGQCSLWLYQWEQYREILILLRSSRVQTLRSQPLQRGKHVKSNHQSLDYDS